MSEPLSPEARHARQDLLPGFGEEGRHRLREARIQVVGAGPMGAPALLELAAAGVGTLYVDDGADVDLFDLGGWLHRPGDAGRPRLLAALEALSARFPAVEVRPAATGVTPGAVLVCPDAEGVAHLASERARQALLPQVVALGGADGGEVVTIPGGAPCLRCATGPAARLQPRGATAAALGSLAALELILLLTGQAPRAGRRVVLSAGRLRAEPTARRPGCGCGRG